MSQFRTPNPYDALPELPALKVTSETFTEGQTLPTAQTSGKMGVDGGEDQSPQLTWEAGPESTRSYVVTCFDPDAPTASGFWHWAVANIPAGTTSLPVGAGTPDSGDLPQGAITLRNDASFKGFVGAAPPEGHGPHRYIFAVHAISEDSLPMEDDSSVAFLGFNMFFKAIARGTLTGLFEA